MNSSHMISFKHHSKPLAGVLLSPFYRWGACGSVSISHCLHIILDNNTVRVIFKLISVKHHSLLLGLWFSALLILPWHHRESLFWWTSPNPMSLTFNQFSKGPKSRLLLTIKNKIEKKNNKIDKPMKCHYLEIRAGWPHTKRPSGLKIWVGDLGVTAPENNQAVRVNDLSWHLHWGRHCGPGKDMDGGADVGPSLSSL